MPLSEELKLKISLLPESPGVYIYYNAQHTVIYVGKAKKLKRRVSSYFNRVHPVARTNILVRNIADMDHVVVKTEEDALHLENSLIKQYQPHYNVLLKDDKSYPWICITSETFPRVFLCRDRVAQKGAKYFGPYANVGVARAVLEVIRKLYPLRTCNHALLPASIEAKKYPLCLKYHLKSCCGCCQGLVSHEEYAQFIEEIRQILRGDTQRLMDYLMEQMQQLAAQWKFERAQELKEKYQLIEKYQAKTVIVNRTITNIDVYSMVRDEGNAYINFMHVRGGAIVQSLTLDYKIRLDESDEELMSMAVNEITERFPNESVREVITTVVPDTEFERLNFSVPQRGDKMKLIEVSLQNAKQYLAEKLQLMEKLNPDQRLMRTLKTIQRDFRLTELPRHIECFDNSNIQGTNPVASCVVFKNAKPSKKDYRHFCIKTVVGPDDFASMKEVLTRRYSRLVDELQDLPQLVIVDGGKGQLSAAVEAFDEMGLRGKIALVGIAKRLEEIYFPGDSVPLYIDKNSESLKVVQHLRDEAHRFGITHHRLRRSKGQIQSTFDEIKGVGPKTQELLIKHFKSLKRIREASFDDIAAVVGEAKAKILVEALNNQADN